MPRHKLGPARGQSCVRCGGQATNWHHRLSRGRGGLHDSFNLVPLCGSGSHGCHGWVTGHPDLAEAEGLYVRGQIIRGRYLGPDGTYHQHYNLGVDLGGAA